MSKQVEQPFPVVLETLLSAEDLPIHLLYRLSDMTDDQFGQFRTRWDAADADRRAVVARHLADIAEEEYLVDFGPVFTFLLNDESAAVRVAALDGVWDSEDIYLIPRIIKLMQADREVAVRAAAARALAHYVLLGEWGQIDARHTAQIVDALLAEYEKITTPIEVKRAALEAVSPAPDPRITDLIRDAYEVGSDELQLSAIFAMGNSTDERWLPVLEAELTNPSPDFRAEAARACGLIGSESAIEELEELLTDDNIEVSAAAIYALAQIGGDQAMEILSRIAEDPDFEPLYDVIDDAIDEMEWVDNSLGFLSFSNEDDDEDDDLIDELRLN